MLISYVHKTNFATLSEQQKIKRKERDARHFAPANKEWKNSVYAYNKSNLLNIAAKDKKVASIIRSYFNLVPKPINVTKSKRMRDLLRSSSTRQLFVSKPEVKQNNDKAIVTVYTHDREKMSYLKKLILLNRWLNCNIIGPNFLTRDRKKSDGYLVRKYIVGYLLENKVFNKKRRITFRASRNYAKRSLPKFRVESRFFEKTVRSLLNKKQFISNTLYYHFLKWVLSIFNIKISLISSVKSILYKNKKDKKENKVVETEAMDLILTKIEKGKKKSKNKVIAKKNITILGTYNIKLLKIINIILLQYLMINVNNTLDINQKNKVYGLFNLFREKYFNAIARKHIKKEVLIIKYLTKLYLNKFKYHNYLPGLKTMLSNIYDKKVQLNIVSLKYLHLNSDLFSEAISIKLRKRTTSLFRVLRKSFKLVKTFKPNSMFLLSENQKNTVINDIKTYFGKYNVINGNVLNIAFKEMFKNKNVFNKQIKGLNTTVKDILTSLNYKWVTGLRVEAAGRLTKRYAAARALFKYKYKGTLKNLEHLKNIENKLQSPSVSLMRGDARPNTQYSFVPSKRRIGAFGIKSWISNS